MEDNALYWNLTYTDGPFLIITNAIEKNCFMEVELECPLPFYVKMEVLLEGV